VLRWGMEKMRQENWKVLVVDDEEGIRKVMSITLADAGYQVLTAEDGASGMRLCREESPQIVITDIRMPGMDGVELLRRIKEEDPDKEVIVITAFGELQIAVEALQLDASDFITKPIYEEALFIALERAKNRFATRRKLHDYTTLLEERWMDTADELARTIRFQKNLVHNSIDGIIGWDNRGTIVTFNKSLEKMLGYAQEEVRGKMTFERFFGREEAERFKKALLAEEHGGKNRLHLFEANLLDRGGEKIPAQLTATLLFEEDAEIGTVAFVKDLREIRRLEQEFDHQSRILHQDKMMSLGRLAASVAHEINNPLSGMLNYLLLMIKMVKRGPLERESAEKFEGYLSLIEGEVRRCSQLVSNLLAFSRKSELEFSEIDINGLLKKCVLLSQHKLSLQNIQIRTYLDPALPKIWGDFNQIQQCVINLIFNSIDAMPRGGTLTLRSACFPQRGTAEIQVIDTGSGIAKEDIPKVFDPFFSKGKEGKGVGLGLSTVRGIIEHHKGSIHLDSDPGKGTVFTMGIPLGRSNV